MFFEVADLILYNGTMFRVSGQNSGGNDAQSYVNIEPLNHPLPMPEYKGKKIVEYTVPYEILRAAVIKGAAHHYRWQDYRKTKDDY